MRSESGFSLMEFLVSMSLTLVVLAISLSSFNDALAVNQAASVVGDTDLNLRVGIEVMSRDLIQTGTLIRTGGISVPTGAGATPIQRPGPPGPPITFTPVNGALAAIVPGAGLGPSLAGQQTDIVTVFYGDMTLDLGPELPSISIDGTRATVDAAYSITNPGPGIPPVQRGDLILFENTGLALQMVTGTDGAQTMMFDPGDPLNLNQQGAAQGTILKLQNPPQPFEPPSYPPTKAKRVFMVTYYIDATNPQGPRLTRQVNAGPPLAIAMNIENLQLSYDLVDSVLNPTNQKTPIAPNSANEIRKVNLFLQAHSDQVQKQTRQWFRNSMATQISLRSMSFEDRYK